MQKQTDSSVFAETCQGKEKMHPTFDPAFLSGAISRVLW